jgi:hypothetical protein
MIRSRYLADMLDEMRQDELVNMRQKRGLKVSLIQMSYFLLIFYKISKEVFFKSLLTHSYQLFLHTLQKSEILLLL